MQELKHKFVIMGSGYDYYNYAYAQVNDLENVLFLNNIPYGKLTEIIYRIHMSQRVNSIINLPLKKVWSKILFNKLKKEVNGITRDKNDFICFVFFSVGHYGDMVKYGFCDYVREYYPNSYMVVFYQDIIKKERKVSFEEFKEKMDLIISYDFREAQEYGILHYNVPYSDINNTIKASTKTSDVYFIGAAKDRYNEIISVYEKLKSFGLKCDFNIKGVEKKEQKYVDEINYCDYISYKENLEKVKATKCIIEIKQLDSTGYTLRTPEAIIFGKKLLSNNEELMEAPFYSEDKIQVFKNIDDIKLEFFNDMSETKYDYKDKLSPMNFLSFIEENLEE